MTFCYMGASDFLRSRLLLLAVAIATGIGALVGIQLMDSRAALLNRAQAANMNLLFTVSHVMDSALQAADRSLRYTVSMTAQLERMAIENGADQEGVYEALRDARKDLFYPQLVDERYGVQVILDDKGTVVTTSRQTPSRRINFSHRPYFLAHLHQSNLGFYLSSPFVSEFDDQPSVAMSRRWEREDGSFGGVVVQTLKLASLNSLFSSFQLGPDSGISVLLKDGSVLTHFPYDADMMSKSVEGMDWFNRFRRHRQGSYTGLAGLGPVEGLHVYRTLDNYPVILTVTQASDTLLEPWVHNARWLGLATLILMGACVWLAWLAEQRMAAQRLAAARLGRARQELQTIVESLPVLVSYWDDQLINRMANTAHREWTGLWPEEMLGKHGSIWLDEEQLRRLQPRFDAVLAGDAQLFEWELRDIKGNLRHVIVNYIPDRQNGVVKGFFAMVTDITDRRVVEVALLDEKERFRVILESIKDGVITTTRDGQILYLNPAAAEMIGWSLHEVRGKLIDQVMKLEDPHGIAQRSILRDVLATEKALEGRVEQVLIGPRGERTHIESWAAPIFDEQGQMRGAVNVFHEIGQVRKMANRMAHLAQHDALTGLPNRRMLDQAGERSLAVARGLDRGLAVLYLDLDGFKQVNDEYGHAVGDELLIAVTRRLARQLRAADRLYRQGGDEFVVWAESVQNLEEAERLSQRLIECCQTPVSCASGHFTVTLSIGISLFPDDGDEPGELIQRADRGMYAAKNAGRNQYARVSLEVSGRENVQ